MQQLRLNIYGSTCLIESENVELLARLSRDFAYFVKEFKGSANFHFKHFHSEPPLGSIPDFPRIYTSKNSKTYEKDGVRFNDYYGKLLSVYDYNRDVCTLYSTDLSRSHEIIYLLVHSRIGKKLDLQGLHRIHAMGVRKNKSDFLFVSDSGVGKSTLLSHWLGADENLQLISDDCPIVDEQGNVYPFPIRLGASEKETLLSLGQNIYELQREEHGLKYLLSTSEIKNKVAWSHSEKTYLAFGKRVEGSGCVIKRIGFLKSFSHLIRAMVIGVGLPMILEYWWELGPEDFSRKARIGFKRLLSSLVLAYRSECCEIAIGSNPDENIRTIRKYLNWI